VKQKSSLPVDSVVPEITASLSRNPNLVLEAPPGAGKTTRVPPALLDIVRGGVVVLEPRRIAARLAARRVAAEMGQQVGDTVGYQVRFEEVAGPKTRLRFATEGVLTRRLLSDPTLKGIDAVVLDEFHERHLESDLALALLKSLQKNRPELKLVVMSATLAADPVARYLGECPIVRSEGKLYNIAVTHLPYSREPLEKQVSGAVELLLREGHVGHILVFLPGAAEIRRAMRECEGVARRANLLMLPLHGSLTPEEQDRAVAPSEQPKLILATNVAESSITVDGVTAVIDSGLARIATHSPWSGLPTLHVSRVSQASARQRAGRAGRTAPGRVVRLYSEEDYNLRPEHDAPEILRTDLSQLCLDLRAIDLNPHDLEWLNTPPVKALESAEKLLERLGVSRKMAKEMARLPLNPRLSRIVLESMRNGVGEDGCVAAALLGSGAEVQGNDLLAAMEKELDFRTRQHIKQLQRIARPVKQKVHDDDALLKSVLAGFADRVARRRLENQITLASGGSAEVAGQMPRYEFMVAVDAEDRKDKPLPIVRLVSKIEPEWLIDQFPERVREENKVVWNRTAERVDALSTLVYDQLVLQESSGSVPPPVEAAIMLAEKAIEAGIERFVDVDSLHGFEARAEFAGFTPPSDSEALRQMCEGLRSFGELKKAAQDLIPQLQSKIGRKQLEERAPARLRLKNGRETPVHYERGKPPWIESRLQDFFGMRDTPRIGPNKTPVVVHLLAPNRRPVQTTSDLAGFWERLYPQVRRELMRRYPKHSWPENPFIAG
jgi:ATP-dependent helicase HrpB